VDLPALLEIGHKFQKETDWIPPTQRVKTVKGGEGEAATAAAETDS
jgi:hypothetical protein